MKLVTFIHGNHKRLGALINSSVVDFSLACKEYSKPELPGTLKEFLELGPDGISKAEELLKSIQNDLDKAGKTGVSTPLSDVRLCPPIENPEKIICIGQNYKDHCLEQNVPIPERPILFTKFITCLVGPKDPVKLPTISDKIDFEAELAFVIGKTAKHVSLENAMDYVAGYMIFNDITARDIQKGDGQWIRGKSCDTFGPCGPALITKNEIHNPHNLAISLKLNGQVMQDSNTKNLIFDIPYLIWFITQNITLKPGDIISTGTPPGVGFARNPPVFLKKGDCVETILEGLGTLINHMESE